MLFYIDYLDHEIHNNRSFILLSEWLRYDLLIFATDTLCMSVPACVKLQDTTGLLIQLDEFWNNKIIKLQLDNKHAGKAHNYFNNRKKVLEQGMQEEQLVKHFEFIAYTDNRTENFFNVYLPQMLITEQQEIFIAKKYDTDALFRKNTVELITKYYDSFCNYLYLNNRNNDFIIFTGIIRRIESLANDMNSLFQRKVIEDCIKTEFNPSPDKIEFITTILDRAFSLANAETSIASPLSLVLNQLTGRWLARLLKKTYNNLYNLICELQWSEIYELSQDEDWRSFISYVNAFIWLVQDSAKNNMRPIIESSINKLSRYISVLSFWKVIKEEAIDAVKQKMYEHGLISEAQNFELMLELYADCYAGRHKILLDVVSATDMLANRIMDKLDKEKRLKYLLDFEKKQKQKGYEIFK